AHPTPDIRSSVEVAPPLAAIAPSRDDVTADLAAEPARITGSYADVAAELVVLAREVRPQWTDDQRFAFDARLTELQGSVDRAADGRPRQRAWRELIRYVQGAIIRDDVALASGGPR
nr:hypothetical protein [Myxococcota bacterium]